MLRAALIHRYLAHGPGVSRAVHRALAAVSSRRKAVEFYWSAACPWSYVMAQQLDAVLGSADVPLVVRPVPLGAHDVNPEPALRVAHGPRDCAALAAFYDISFPDGAAEPGDALVARAQRTVVDTPSLARCIAAGRAVWGGDAAALDGLSLADESATREALASNAARQRAGGHYQTGSVRYLGEWFEGPMRLALVADRLRHAGGNNLGQPLRRRAEVDVTRAAPGTPLEIWFSFRSPYSYLAVHQIDQWRQRGETFAVALRPVLPMVMRGLAVPRAKKMYLVKDAAREARRLGIPFGRIADPVGDGARRCLAVCAAISSDGDTGRAFDFAVSAARGIWSEGIDVATDAGLERVAERAGLSRDDVHAGLADLPAGEALAETNRATLTGDLGLWGVPSFRVGDALTIWGQDRLDLVRHALSLGD